MAKSMEKLSTMLEGLNRAAQRVGLKMNMDKTKIMSNVHVAPTRVMVENSVLEVVDNQRQIVQLGRPNFEKEKEKGAWTVEVSGKRALDRGRLNLHLGSKSQALLKLLSLQRDGPGNRSVNPWNGFVS
nr:uncharacterized protein LOC116775715 [Danaus plexippus plexippus]